MSDSHLSYRRDIDGLRAVAVLPVVAFHASTHLAPGGFIGVDVFFVISGFLISGIILRGLQDGTFRFADFYVRRIRRIFPALIVVLLGTWTFGWFLLEPQEYVLLGKHMVAGAGFVSNILSWHESGYFDPSSIHKPLLHLWSLGIEEQFYLLWPLLLSLAWAKRASIALLIAAVLGLSFAINVMGVGQYPIATFYLPFSRFWELMAGGALAYASLHCSQQIERYQAWPMFRWRATTIRVRDVGAVIALVLILAAAEGLNQGNSFPGWWALMPTMGAALLILSGPGGWVNRTVLAWRPMVAIGLISYPLYLWHWPLLFFFRTTSAGPSASKLVALMAAVALAFALSYATYRFLERPLRYGFPARKSRVAAWLSVAVGGMAVLGVVTIAAGGWSRRYPANVRGLLEYSYDYQTAFRQGRCLLDGETSFPAECEGTPGADPNQPRILIWGDSHGAMLYGALNQMAAPRGVDVAQYTSSSCPPVLNFDKQSRPLCHALNLLIIQQIERLRPTTVLLVHDWPQSQSENALAHLPETVKALRDAHVQRIVLVGPVPHWKDSLHAAVVRYMRFTGASVLPERMTYSLVESTAGLDEDLASMAKSLSIEYLSSYRTFCNPEGCLIALGSPVRELTAFDDAHLSLAGAQFLVVHNAPLLFDVGPSAGK